MQMTIAPAAPPTLVTTEGERQMVLFEDRQTVCALPAAPCEALLGIARLDQELFGRFQKQLRIDEGLSRALVSYQASKRAPFYRWYKYKEAFSPALIEYLLKRSGVTDGTVLDPFAGSGTTLFVASHLGLDAEGIELLPVSQYLIDGRARLERHLSTSEIERIRQWVVHRTWETVEPAKSLPTLRITRHAYPEATARDIERILTAIELEQPNIRTFLFTALLCIVESISYTRKDGQYLRWDERSGRKLGSKSFRKPELPDIATALGSKVAEMLCDIETSRNDDTAPNGPGAVRLLAGSVLDLMPELVADSYSGIVTSPPYCNRYDYTRTYALELALLGLSDRQVIELRQEMLSCTVENRSKDRLALDPRWRPAMTAVAEEPLLQAVLCYLEDQRTQGRLNNDGIPRMVRGYFNEMACVLAECHRVLRPGAPLMMVNDNVRYAGASISVDLILSRLAEALGFLVEEILVVPAHKGNSSQQMGQHGRDPLRKCVYVWRKRIGDR